MLELKIHFKYLNLNLLIGKRNKLPNPFFTLNEEEYDEEEESDIPTSENSFEQSLSRVPATQITELANRYMNELNGTPPTKDESLAYQTDSAAPPCGTSRIQSDVSPSLASGSIFLHKDGYKADKGAKSSITYDIGDKHSDELAKEFTELPDVEIIDDDYEKRLIESAKLVNQRYLMYKETHGLDEE